LQPGMVIYSAALGTLPEAQGWRLREDPPGFASPRAVKAGVLHLGPTTRAGDHYWAYAGPAIDFDQGFCMEASVKVVSSSYGTHADGAQRAGWAMVVVDRHTRMFALYVAHDRVFIHEGQHTHSMPAKLTAPTFDPTDGFHTYRFVVGRKTDFDASALGVDAKTFASLPEHVAALFVDGSRAAFIIWNAGLGEPDEGLADYSNLVSFGDPTGYESSETELKYFGYTSNVARGVRSGKEEGQR